MGFIFWLIYNISLIEIEFTNQTPIKMLEILKKMLWVLYRRWMCGYKGYNSFLRDQDVWLVKPKWGGKRLGSGLALKQAQKSDSDQGQQMYLSHLDKSHLHYGGGELTYPRVFPGKALYNVTDLKKSTARATDELVASSNKIDVRIKQINLPSPAEHPYGSHTSRMAVFPGLASPDDTENGRVALATALTLPSNAASATPGVDVKEKTKGSPYRREVVRVINDSERKPLQWHEHSFNQLVKSPDVPKQRFYPTPPSSVKPNFLDRSSNLTVSQRTANALRNLQAFYGKSEYSQQYTGNGPKRHVKLDNYDKVLKGRVEPRPLPENCWDPGQLWRGHNKSATDKDVKMIVELDKDRSYTTTYQADYMTESQFLNRSTPTSILIGDQARENTKNLKNSAKGNKTVKFNNKITISDGYRTSSGFVNDFQENICNEQTRQCVQHTPFNLKKEVPMSRSPVRPGTAPAVSRETSTRVLPEQSTTTAPIQLITPNLKTQLRPGTTGSLQRLSNQLLEIQNAFSKSAAHRKFHNDFPENSPDLRRKPDTRITTNERRHLIPEVGCHSYYFHG